MLIDPCLWIPQANNRRIWVCEIPTEACPPSVQEMSLISYLPVSPIEVSLWLFASQPKLRNAGRQRTNSYSIPNVCFTDEFSPNFDLKNMIPTKGFFMGKMAQIRQISNLRNSKSPESYDNFQKVAKNIKGSSFFPSFISIM